jgi:twinkle protein
MASFSDHGIHIKETAGHARTTCPECSPARRKATEPCLSVDVSEGLWFCHHCGWSGSLKNGKKPDEIKKHFSRPTYKRTSLPAHVIQWFAKRGISERVLELNQIGYGPSFNDTHGIQFPYLKDGEVVNIKHRSHNKRFRQEKGAVKCLYRFDEITKGKDTLIITEGEIDALSVQEVGYERVCSIPDGAPSAEAKEYRTKFDFLNSAIDIIAPYERVILATDNDAPGRVAEKELARRIGIERCYRVEYPAGCKDANDVLVKHGAKALRKVIDSATPFPIEGVFSIGDLKGDLEQLYDRGPDRGLSTGWDSVDRIYTIKPGEMTIVTGIPGSGKSEWLDALQINMIGQHDWRFAVCSPENWPPERHAKKYVEKVVSRPFGIHGQHKPRMEKRQIAEALLQLHQHIFFIMPKDELLTIEIILEKARALIARHGVNGLIVDPWNELEHMMEPGQREDMYISKQLTRLRRFARTNGIHIWVVAHPRNLRKDENGDYKPPTMYEISGGAQWRNKADNGICVHRPNFNRDETIIYTQKIRFKEVGRLGMATLKYSRDTGEYRDFDSDSEQRGLYAV